MEGTTVRIGDPLTQIIVHSSTLISATIPNSDRFKNPTNLIEQEASVVITDPKGRSTVGYNRFTIKVHSIIILTSYIFDMICNTT